jgi:hypothetical protein
MCEYTYKHILFSYACDVRRHNHPILGPSVTVGDPHEIITFLASQQVPAGDPHGLVNKLVRLESNKLVRLKQRTDIHRISQN